MGCFQFQGDDRDIPDDYSFENDIEKIYEWMMWQVSTVIGRSPHLGQWGIFTIGCILIRALNNNPTE